MLIASMSVFDSLKDIEPDKGDWDYGINSPWNKGKAGTYKAAPHSEETKKKISESLKGNVPWNKGKKGVQNVSEETKQKMSQTHKKRFEAGYTAWNKGKSKYKSEEEKKQAAREAALRCYYKKKGEKR